MKRLPHIAVLIALLGCDFNPAADVPVAAAHTLAQRYTAQKLRIHAAGNDCRILFVRTKTTFDDATVESIHYGTSESGSYDGGIQQFAEDNRFRAVVYRDAAGGLWTYGATTHDEAREMRPCR